MLPSHTIQAFVLPMLHARQDLAFRCSIALQFIGDDHAWDVLQSLEELAEEAFRCFFVAAALRPVYPARCRLDPLLATNSVSLHGL